VKVGGRRAYAVARKGGTPALQPRRVVVHELRLEPLSADTLHIRVTCGAGTYVRSLARDIGRALGTAGHLAALRRTRLGSFELDDAWSLESLGALVEAGMLGEIILPADEGVAGLSAALIAPDRASALAHGTAIAVPSEGATPLARVYDFSGEFVAIGRIRADKMLQPLKVFTL
jgi:tRNA pseudouridine55 synthase